MLDAFHHDNRHRFVNTFNQMGAKHTPKRKSNIIHIYCAINKMASTSNFSISTLKWTTSSLDPNENLRTNSMLPSEMIWVLYSQSKITEVQQVYKSRGAKYHLAPSVKWSLPLGHPGYYACDRYGVMTQFSPVLRGTNTDTAVLGFWSWSHIAITHEIKVLEPWSSREFQWQLAHEPPQFPIL